jgi:hypothetical protein
MCDVMLSCVGLLSRPVWRGGRECVRCVYCSRASRASISGRPTRAVKRERDDDKYSRLACVRALLLA